LINRILSYEISLETALFILILSVVLLSFLLIVINLFTAWKQIKHKDVIEEIPEQKPEDKDVFKSLEKDFYSTPSSGGLRTLAAALVGISLLLFMGLLPAIMGSHSRYQSSPETPPLLKYLAGFIFSATAIVFACLWRNEYTFIENRNIRTDEKFPSRLLRFFLRNTRISGLLSVILIFTAYDLIIFNITNNGFIITALLIYAFVFFLLAIVKKKPFHS
jgi:putative flippase GtrA